MTEAKQKAKQKAKEMVDKERLEVVKENVKEILSLAYMTLHVNPTEANSHSFQYWGDVMDELNEMEL